MDLLLGLAGLTGLAALLQSKVLPTEKDYQKATLDLVVKPDDPALNLTAGKYEVFVLNDFQFGLQHLAKGSDKTLAALAQKELDDKNTATPELQVGMGDEWVLAAKKYPPLVTQFYDHASEWYAKAWPKLSDLWKAKVREQGGKLAASRPKTTSIKSLPKNWSGSGGQTSMPSSDGSIARTGSYSVKLPERNSPNQNPEIFLRSDTIQENPQSIELSGYSRAEGTESKNDQLFVNFFNKDGELIGVDGPNLPVDIPVWLRSSKKIDVPKETASMIAGVAKRSKLGILWVDDLSIKSAGKELLKNGSFEQK